MKNQTLLILCLFVSVALTAQDLKPIAFERQTMNGELQTRLERNMQRLQEEKYQPENVFLTMAQSGDWPGDTEGRTILGLVLDAQAAHKEPAYLEEIIRQVPRHLNEKGYMGPVFPGVMHEQQLSGNGWMLRGLSEYYLWKKDPMVLEMLHTLARNLFLPAAGVCKDYPLSPEERAQNVGAESGSIVGDIGRWKLSSDIGCVFIGMEGLIHAYQVTGDKQLRPVVEELVQRFLQMDLLAIKAQTHATLTGCRGLVRYAEITGEKRYIQEAAKRFDLYVKNGMTENFENYNWFCRYDTWTEPCAIVDSYLLAVQLWQHTQQKSYLEWAEQIYYNAICHTQRWNGGFGCDNCPGGAIASADLKVHGSEAHWCCTMRGAEGLSHAARYSCFQDGKQIFFPFYRQADFQLRVREKELLVREETEYPLGNSVAFTLSMEKPLKCSLHFPAYSWMSDVVVELNGKSIPTQEQDGFLAVSQKFQPNDRLTLHFRLLDRTLPLQNADNALEGHTHRQMHGPLLMGREAGSSELRPVYHLMDQKVWEVGSGALQIVF